MNDRKTKVCQYRYYSLANQTTVSLALRHTKGNAKPNREDLGTRSKIIGSQRTLTLYSPPETAKLLKPAFKKTHYRAGDHDLTSPTCSPTLVPCITCAVHGWNIITAFVQTVDPDWDGVLTAYQLQPVLQPVMQPGWTACFL